MTRNIIISIILLAAALQPALAAKNSTAIIARNLPTIILLEGYVVSTTKSKLL